MTAHWLSLYDPETGEPYSTLCRCPIGRDHDGAGRPESHDRRDVCGPERREEAS